MMNHANPFHGTTGSTRPQHFVFSVFNTDQSRQIIYLLPLDLNPPPVREVLRFNYVFSENNGRRRITPELSDGFTAQRNFNNVPLILCSGTWAANLWRRSSHTCLTDSIYRRHMQDLRTAAKQVLNVGDKVPLKSNQHIYVVVDDDDGTPKQWSKPPTLPELMLPTLDWAFGGGRKGDKKFEAYAKELSDCGIFLSESTLRSVIRKAGIWSPRSRKATD